LNEKKFVAEDELKRGDAGRRITFSVEYSVKNVAVLY
jgi:hypothetical protein